MPLRIDQHTGKARKPYDLVICNSVLHEQESQEKRDEIIDELWQMTGEFLVIVERGNPSGYEMILHARNRLVSGIEEDDREAHIFAPVNNGYFKVCMFDNNLQLVPA